MNKKAEKTVGAASASSILGNVVAFKEAPKPENCFVCGKVLDKKRVEALQMLKTLPSMWAHASCADTPKIKGIYMGEVGTSNMLLVKRIYEDSVRGMFKKTPEHGESADPEDNEEPEEKV